MVTKMSEQEAKQLVNRAVLAGEGRWRDFEDSFREILRKDLDSMDLGGSGGLDEIKAVVSELETQFLAFDAFEEAFARSKKT